MSISMVNGCDIIGAACGWRGTNCPRTLPLIFLATLTVAAAPPPRCKANGYYQVSALVFACDGTAGYPQDNQAQVLIRARGSWTQTVPQATRNFRVTADAPVD